VSHNFTGDTSTAGLLIMRQPKSMENGKTGPLAYPRPLDLLTTKSPAVARIANRTDCQ